MPAGRKQVDYTDIRYDALTYKIDNVTILFDPLQLNGSAQVGKAVMLSADDTVALTNAGACVEGKLLKVERDLFCTVQRWGFVTLPKGDGAVTRGRGIVGDLVGAARGYIRQVVSPGAAYVQAEAVEQALGRGQIVNVADTANIVVDLG